MFFWTLEKHWSVYQLSQTLQGPCEPLMGGERGEYFPGLPVHRILRTQTIPWRLDWENLRNTCLMFLACLSHTNWFCTFLAFVVVPCLHHTPAYLGCLFLYLCSAGHQVHWVRVHWSHFLSQGLIGYLLLQSKIRHSYSVAALHVKPSEWAAVTWAGLMLLLPQQIIVSPVSLVGGTV